MQYKPREKIDPSNERFFEPGILLLLCEVSFTSIFLPLSEKPLGNISLFQCNLLINPMSV